VAHLFARGTVAVFPYREIEASGVLSLALAHGRPVIASNLGNFAEWIEDGVQGRLVPPGDVAALTAALASMIGDRDLASACSVRAHGLATQIPDWGEIGRLTGEAYADAAAGAWTATSSQPPNARVRHVSEPVGHG
jgi:glycosyltransferase involved in cell wall biosynthesis